MPVLKSKWKRSQYMLLVISAWILPLENKCHVFHIWSDQSVNARCLFWSYPSWTAKAKSITECINIRKQRLKCVLCTWILLVRFFILQTKRVDLSKSNFTAGSFGVFFSNLGIKSVSSDTCIAVLHSASHLWKTSKLYYLAAYE